MESFLGNTQTLLGTICTLAILCLFAEIKNGDTPNANGNFVFQLIAAIASDVNKNLRKFANKIKQRTEVRKNEIYERFNLKRTESESVESLLTRRCLESKNLELNQKFLKALTKIDTIRRKILVVSEINPQLDEPSQHKFITYCNKRQEPQLVALMVFLISLMFLVADIFQFDNSTIVPFTWFFMLNALAFSFAVWTNHFSHVYKDQVRDSHRSLFVNILGGLICISVPAMGFSLLLYLPFDILSILLAILAPFVCVLVVCLLMYKRYWNTHDYSRTIVLKHMVYFFVSALIGTIVSLNAEGWASEADFQRHVEFFRNPLYARWLLYVVLILDLILVPLYGGYVHMKIDEWMAVRRIKRKVSQYDSQLDEAAEELLSVVTDIIRIADVGGLQPQQKTVGKDEATTETSDIKKWLKTENGPTVST